jgi:hypothetical protein
VKINTLTAPFRHPATQKARVIVRRIVSVCAVILAVAVVTSVAVDVGPALKGLAEREGSRYLGRPLTIGKMSVRLWDGSYVFEDLRIDSLPPTTAPFLVAKKITVVNSWRTLFNRRFVLEQIEMTDWRMHVETLADGRHNFPNFKRGGPRGQSRWTTTLAYVRAHRGEFTFQDFGSNWGVVARNIDVVVEKPGEANYRGTAKFSDGFVALQNYVPFRADMDSAFQLDGGRLVFDRMSLVTEGTRSELIGDVNFNYWPELMLAMKSDIDFPKAKDLFFAGDDFSLSGKGKFAGTFHLFKEILPNGQQRTGRELKGQFQTDVLGVNRYRFTDVRGDVRWTPEVLAVTDSRANAYGGAAHFSYRMAPLNEKGVTPKASFDVNYDGVDLLALSDLFKLEGITLAGRISGSHLLEWPIRRYRDHTGKGNARFTPPEEAVLMSRDMPLERIAARQARGLDAGPFSPLTPVEPVPIGGEFVYEYGPDWIEVQPSHIATESTYVEVQGRTKYGEESDLPFHVSSADWQESDRVFAGVLTAFGSQTKGDPDWWLRDVRWRDDWGVQESAHRRRLRRRTDARLGCGLGSGARQSVDPRQLRGRHRRDHHLGTFGDHDHRAVFAGVPAQGPRRRDQRPYRHQGSSGRRSAPCLRHRGLRHRRAVDRQLRHQRQVPRARGLRPSGDRQRGLLRRARGVGDQCTSTRGQRRAAPEHPDPEGRSAAEPAVPISDGTAPISSTSMRAALPRNRSRSARRSASRSPRC